MTTTFAAWQAAREAEGVDGHGSINDPSPITLDELDGYLLPQGWLLEPDWVAPGQPFTQVWTMGRAPIQMQVRWTGPEGREVIEGIRLSDETGEADAPAVFISEFELGHRMRDMVGRWGPDEIEVYLSPIYREMTGQDGQAESLR